MLNLSELLGLVLIIMFVQVHQCKVYATFFKQVKYCFNKKKTDNNLFILNIFESSEEGIILLDLLCPDTESMRLRFLCKLCNCNRDEAAHWNYFSLFFSVMLGCRINIRDKFIRQTEDGLTLLGVV